VELFTFDDVTYGYSRQEPILKNLSFSIKEGKRTAIVGANGAGKSTILYHLNGLYTPKSGSISFRGNQVDKKTRGKLVQHVGIVFQDPDDQIISLTVKEDIGFGPSQLGVEEQVVESRVEHYMNLLNINHLADKNPADLSYGQKKYVTIAGVLAMQTDVVIFDEPMAFLDPKGKEKMIDIFNLLDKQGKTVIVTTHDMHFVAEWAEEVIVIKDGQSIGDFTPQKLFSSANIMETANLTLPPVVRIAASLWNNENETMPIREKEVKAWLTSIFK